MFPPGGNIGLTARELEILKLIAQGKTNPQIAEQLCIECGTVKRHVHDILTKLDVTNRTEAAIKAVRLGLVRLDDEAE